MPEINEMEVVAKQTTTEVVKRQPPIHLEPASVFVNQNIEPPEWIWEEQLAVGCMTLLVGAPKTGKSLFARNLIRAVTRGDDLLGYRTNKCNAIYLALEEHGSFLQRSFKNADLDNDSLWLHYGSIMNQNIDECLACLAEHIETYKTKLIVIDPLVKFTNFSDFNDYNDVNLTLKPLSDFARKHQVHILVVHHSNKSGAVGTNQILGSTGIFGVSDGAFLLSREGDVGSIKSSLRYGNNLENCQFRYDQNGLLIFDGTKKDSAEHELKARILSYLSTVGATSVEALLKDLQITKLKVVECLKTLEINGVLSKTGKGVKGDPYIYSVSNIECIGQEPKLN